METTVSKAEVDFEGQNWNAARAAFLQRHKDNDRRREFLGDQTTATSVKESCLQLQGSTGNKYAKGLGKILSKMEDLIRVGDLAIKAAPESVGLAWTGIRLCLRAFEDDYAAFQLLSGACADIIEIMISCRVYGRMYGNRKGPDDFQEVHNKVVGYIPTIYADILDFSYTVKKYTSKNTACKLDLELSYCFELKPHSTSR